MKTKLLALLGVSALLLFWAGDKISYQIRRELAGGANLSEASDRFWHDFRDPLHLSFERPDLISGAVLVAVFALFVAYQISNRRKFRHGVEHGSAKRSLPACGRSPPHPPNRPPVKRWRSSPPPRWDRSTPPRSAAGSTPGNGSRPSSRFAPALRKVISTTKQHRVAELPATEGHQEPRPRPPSTEAAVKLLWLAICNIEDKRARERAAERDKPANKRKAPGRLVEGQTTTNWKQALAQLATTLPPTASTPTSHHHHLHKQLDVDDEVDPVGWTS